MRLRAPHVSIHRRYKRQSSDYSCIGSTVINNTNLIQLHDGDDGGHRKWHRHGTPTDFDNDNSDDSYDSDNDNNEDNYDDDSDDTSDDDSDGDSDNNPEDDSDDDSDDHSGKSGKGRPGYHTMPRAEKEARAERNIWENIQLRNMYVCNAVV